MTLRRILDVCGAIDGIRALALSHRAACDAVMPSCRGRDAVMDRRVQDALEISIGDGDRERCDRVTALRCRLRGRGRRASVDRPRIIVISRYRYVGTHRFMTTYVRKKDYVRKIWREVLREFLRRNIPVLLMGVWESIACGNTRHTLLTTSTSLRTWLRM